MSKNKQVETDRQTDLMGYRSGRGQPLPRQESMSRPKATHHRHLPIHLGLGFLRGRCSGHQGVNERLWYGLSSNKCI